MTEEQLVEFLKENLRLDIRDSDNYDRHCIGLSVDLTLKGQHIAGDYLSIYIPRCSCD